MAKESLQKKKGRIRPPRVHIKYEVYIGDAMKMKELPFVVGVMGDYSGNPKEALPPKIHDRGFVNIDRDNFNKVLAGMAPRLTFRVEDKLSGEKDQMIPIELNFKSMDDFSPENVVKQIEPLNELYQQRDKLKSLLAKMDGNAKLEKQLDQILKDTEAQQKIAEELGVDAGAPKESTDS